MTRIERFCLVATAVVISAVSLPPPTSAGSIYGSWSGTATYTESVYNDFEQVQGPYTGTTTATLTIEADPLDQQFSVVTLSISLYWIPIYGTIPTEYIGSQSANFYLDDEQDGPTGWYYFANFFATYQDIGPDGTIVNGDGSAVVDMTYNIPTDGTGEFLYVHFQSDSAVPEPSSLALMISAILVVVSAAWSRVSLKAPRSLRQSPQC